MSKEMTNFINEYSCSEDAVNQQKKFVIYVGDIQKTGSSGVYLSPTIAPINPINLKLLLGSKILKRVDDGRLRLTEDRGQKVYELLKRERHGGGCG